jgi:hypothetical protein
MPNVNVRTLGLTVTAVIVLGIEGQKVGSCKDSESALRSESLKRMGSLPMQELNEFLDVD